MLEKSIPIIEIPINTWIFCQDIDISKIYRAVHVFVIDFSNEHVKEFDKFSNAFSLKKKKHFEINIIHQTC